MLMFSGLVFVLFQMKNNEILRDEYLFEREKIMQKLEIIQLRPNYSMLLVPKDA